MSTSKRIVFTVVVSLVLLGFISFLLYVIYTFGYYDKNEMNELLSIFNQDDFEYVYDHLFEKLDRDTYDNVIRVMYDKNALKDIYYLYYSNSDYDMNEFYNEYYYGDKNIILDDITFEKIGKTTLVKRSEILYKNISVVSRNGKRSTIGVLHNVSLEIDSGSVLSIDGKELECIGNQCILNKVYGGLHEIQYVNNNITYYGLLNIVSDDQVINISGLESLVKINHKDDLKSIQVQSNSVITPGIYRISKCYKSTGCGDKKKSYMMIYPDNTVEYYIYADFDQAGDYYKGSYFIDRNYFNMSFSGHTYSVYDYDYGSTTRINTEVETQMKYKIKDNKSIYNDDYLFVFVEELSLDEENEE